MKFWANLDNWAKYGLKAVQIVSGGIEQGKTLREEYDSSISNTQLRNLTPEDKQYFLTHPNQDSLGLVKSNDTLYSYEKILPKMTYRNGAFYDIGFREINDTLVDKRQLSKLKEFINATNKKNLKLAEEKFDNGNY